MIALVLIGFIMLALLQIPSLIKNYWWRELICFAALWSMGLILSIMVTIGIKLPPISTIIGKSISGIFGI